MQQPTIEAGDKGAMIVTGLDGAKVTYAANKGMDAIRAYNAALATWNADQASRAAAGKPAISAALDYRNQLVINGPNGFPVITGTAETFDWLREFHGTIMATFEANKSKVATNATKAKALPKGEKRPEKTPVAIVTPQ